MIEREPVQIHKRKSFTPKQRAAIFERNGGVCYLSGVKIMPGDLWEVEHRLALALGGTNDIENLVPALVDPHRIKTKQDVKAIAKAKRLIKKSDPETRKPSTLRGRPFQKGKKQQWPKQAWRKRET